MSTDRIAGGYFWNIHHCCVIFSWKPAIIKGPAVDEHNAVSIDRQTEKREITTDASNIPKIKYGT